MSGTFSHVVGIATIVVVASSLFAPHHAFAADVYGDPVFTFSMDKMPSVDGFFNALQTCLDLPTLVRGSQDVTVASNSNRATVRFTLVDASDVTTLKQYIDQETATMLTCLHTNGAVENVEAGYGFVPAPPTSSAPSSTTTDKMLEIGLPLGGCFIGVIIGLVVAFMCIRARNARLAEEAAYHGDLNQPMAVKVGEGGEMPPPRKAAPAPVRRGADLA